MLISVTFRLFAQKQEFFNDVFMQVNEILKNI